jgi:hypothetical protein
MDDDAIRALVTRLARPHASGGTVVARAAILAEGADFDAVMTWITAHDGQPEAEKAAAASGGLHGARMTVAGGAPHQATARRFVLPPGTLS